ncbi:hypothetical protein CYMTET_33062 [Cymbomonas tetramitiformis]|nr:hypothetical protein CYMTET_33062 [Cymbomonas tetramitiformis]
MCRKSVKARAMVPYALFPALCLVDLGCIHKELKAVQLKTLNKERAEMITGKWLDTGRIPSFAEVANDERILIPASLDEGSLPLQIRPLGDVVPTVEELDAVLAASCRVLGQPTKYVLTYRPAEKKHGLHSALQRWMAKAVYGNRKSRIRGRAVVALHSDAATSDILCALLQAAHLRRLPYRADLTAEQARSWAMEESLRRAVRDQQSFMRAASSEGWITKTVLLSSAERATFHVDGGMQALAKACQETVGSRR